MDLAELLRQLKDCDDSLPDLMSPESPGDKSSAFDASKALEALKEQLGISKPNLSNISSLINHIYISSRSRIFKLADKLAVTFDGDEIVNAKRGQIPLPAEEKWDFKLGDRVRVKCSLKDFESVQRRTIGWTTRLVVVHGHTGVVTDVASEYDNVINVLFLDIFQGCSLYAGVLEKVPTVDVTSHLSRWKIGDMVKTKVDTLLAKKLQSGLKAIPKKLLGKKGRVTAVARFHVEVTFDDKESVQVSAALLVRSEDQSPIIKSSPISKFKVGEKVRIIQNMESLISNQKGKGGWNKEMSKLRGQVVVIASIHTDSSLIVHAKHDRPWRVSPDSVLPLDVEEIDSTKTLDFLPGDLVKIKIHPNMGMTLASQNIPMVFLEYLRGVAEIASVDDDFDCFVKFNQSQKFMMKPDALEKPTAAEIEKFKKIQARVMDLTVGDEVHIDVGPPNYVRVILRDSDFQENVKMALVNPAKLVGFIDYDTAVIEYHSGSRFKIGMKYLTVPDKYMVKDAKKILDFDTAKSIRDMIAKSVYEICTEHGVGGNNYKVDVTSMTYGSPPSIEIRIQSVMCQLDNIVQRLQQLTGWKIAIFCDGQYFLTGVAGFDSEINLSIIFNDSESIVEKQGVRTSIETFEEPIASENEAIGFVDDEEPIASPPGGNQQQPLAHRNPNVRSLREFRYYCLYDRQLGHTVYFPYVIRGQRRVSAEFLEEGLPDPREPTVINNNYVQCAGNFGKIKYSQIV